MQTLEEKVRSLPDEPGVYQYFDQNGRLLYIGKAKSLKKRVKSYFRFTPFAPAPNLSPRIYKMINETADLDYIRVQSEQDALILENSLIKQLKPKYNILLRDDKTYPYIYIDFNEAFPRPKITRKVIKRENIKYYGPFPSAARDILDSLYELFPLVQKESCIKGKKACLFYQIKKCLAPCEGRISQEEYRGILDNAIELIHNKKALLERLKEKMLFYAQSLRFEEAGEIRDRIKRIEAIEIGSELDIAKIENLDIFAIYTTKEKTAVVRMFMREGKVIASSSTKFIFDPQKGFDLDEAYKRILLEFYTHDTPLTATKILVAHDFEEKEKLQNFLSQKFSKKITISHPKRGQKKELIDLAMLNAKELLRAKEPKEDILRNLQELFGLENYPQRIEIFDNSHISGSTPVGAMVVCDSARLIKSAYRHYNLTTTTEYEQMRELLVRRCESFKKNPPPDLWIIDGGETLRQLAKNVLKTFHVKIDVIAIAKEKIDAKAHRAKGKANDLLYYEGGVLKLLPNDKRLLFVQHLRDEAHRFALKFHKQQRNRHAQEINLLSAQGIGPAKVKKLLDYFGTFQNIYNASFDELANILNERDAKSLLDLKKQRKRLN